MSRSLSQAQVAKYLIKIRDAQESFESFVRLMYPDWELADFQLELIDALDKLEKDELGANNLLITMHLAMRSLLLAPFCSPPTTWLEIPVDM